MIQKIQPQALIWVLNSSPQAGHLSEKNDDLAVQYEDVHDLVNSSYPTKNNSYPE